MAATNKTQSFTRHYPIDDDWLALYTRGGTLENNSRYVDIDEIRKNPQGSQYLLDLVTMGKSVDFTMEKIRASFVDNGTFVGDNDNGKYIDGQLMDDTYRDKQKYAEGIEHPVRYKKIYAWETTARHIWFTGFGSWVYDNTDYSPINAQGIPQ